MQHIWWVGSMYRYTLSQGVQAGSVLAVAYAYHNISVRTARRHVACVPPAICLVQCKAGLVHAEYSSPKFQTPLRVSVQVGSNNELLSGEDPVGGRGAGRQASLRHLAHLFLKLQTNSFISHRIEQSQSIIRSMLDVEVPLLKCQPVLTPFNYIPFGTKSHELLSFFIYNTEVRNSM